MVHFSTPIPLEHYERLMEISLDLASTLDLTTLLNRINSLAMELSEAESAAIYFFDDRKDQLTLAVTDRPETERLITQNKAVLETCILKAIQTRQAMMIPDSSTERPLTQASDQPAAYSLMVTPMMAKGKVIGVLVAFNKRADVFTPADLEKFQVLSAQAAVAIENARLFQQVDLISDFVHELRTPLTSINTINELIQRNDITREQRKQFSELLQSEIQRLKDLTNNFLDYSRLESGRLTYHPSKFSAVDLIRESCEFIRPRFVERNLSCSLDFAEDLPLVEADHDKIKQVLLNLIGNAIKYNRPKGQVTIKAWADLAHLYISVADTGIGIPPEEIQHISERFYRASNAEKNSPGTGLGISICKQIIEGHRGSLTIESQLGSGSLFTFSLPL